MIQIASTPCTFGYLQVFSLPKIISFLCLETPDFIFLFDLLFIKHIHLLRGQVHSNPFEEQREIFDEHCPNGSQKKKMTRKGELLQDKIAPSDIKNQLNIIYKTLLQSRFIHISP